MQMKDLEETKEIDGTTLTSSSLLLLLLLSMQMLEDFSRNASKRSSCTQGSQREGCTM